MREIRTSGLMSGERKRALPVPYSSAPAHLANDPAYKLKHKSQRATITLYLDRWRKEFSIPSTGPTLWNSRLRNPRQASFLQDVAALIGQPPQRPTPLPLPATFAAARGS